MRGKYLVQNRFLYVGLKVWDALLSFRKIEKPSFRAPKKILLANIAHLGDVVLTTSILPYLKKHYPDAKIGFLVGSWSRGVLEDHPYIEEIHTFDHMKLQREPISYRKKYKRHKESEKRAIEEISQVGYDLAIDFYPYFPNAIPLMTKANIPIRIGYTSGGAGPLLTHEVDWKKKNQHVIEDYFDLLSLIGVIKPDFLPRPTLGPIQKFPLPAPLEEKKYVVIHMGSARRIKRWSVSSWKEVVAKLVEKGIPIVLTGKGKEENQMAMQIVSEYPKVLNFCDLLDWRGISVVIAKAKLLMGVDSVSAHIASAYHVPAVILYTGINPIGMWGAVGCKWLINVTACYPCGKKNGCASMECLQSISSQKVISRALQIWEDGK